MSQHKAYMQRCLDLAIKGIPTAFPNPLVGSVVVHNGNIIGEGYHQQYGKEHAEVNAINSVKNPELLKESTLYVNLEPCAHYGKTPPCSNLIIEKQIPRVVIGCVDSFSEVAGKGIEKMEKAGVDVSVGVLEKESRKLNKRFFTYHEKKRPYVILKWARTTDGFIAPEHNHENNRWISEKKTQVLVHKWRAEESAILIGKNTVIKDNPSLTTREWTGNNPLRVVIDKNLETLNGDYTLFKDKNMTLVFNQVNEEDNGALKLIKIVFNEHVLQAILSKLYDLGIQSLIVEGGAKTLQSFYDENLYDEIRIIEGDKKFNKGVKEPNIRVNFAEKIEIGNDTLFIHEK